MFKRIFGRDEAPAAEPIEPAPIAQSLEKTRKGFLGRLAEVFGPVDISEATWEDLEAQLIQSDVGVQTAVEIVAELREKARFAGLRRASELPELLRTVMVRTLRKVEAPAAARPAEGPEVVLVVGVNGSGKTTSIAKLARRHRAEGQKVVLVAADTFRAAAIDQLKLWGERIGVPVVAGQPDGDPGAVVFDALNSNQGRQADIVIVDTAGRLHTQTNLMAELVKVRRVAQRVIAEAPHETLLVLDATTGQNGLAQARAFTEAVAVSGLILAKLDSSAKGGVAFAVTRELGLPIRYIGTGERVEDLAVFDPEAYVDGVLGRD